MDAQYLTLTTALDAVNTMLSTIGEIPVNTLTGDLTADTLMAQKILGRVMREVQIEGWYFNTEHEYPLNPDVNGEVLLANNIVHADPDPMRYTDKNLVVRGNKLYDRKNHTYNIGETVYVTAVFILPFEQLPESARNYITIKASRIFLDQTVGSDTLHGFSEQDELRAKVRFKNDMNAMGDFNLLHNLPGYRMRYNATY